MTTQSLDAQAETELAGDSLARGSEAQEITVEEEETMPAKVIARPNMPTQAEIDRHRVDHIPYRSWCPECVEGFGRERAHVRADAERRTTDV